MQPGDRVDAVKESPFAHVGVEGMSAREAPDGGAIAPRPGEDVQMFSHGLVGGHARWPGGNGNGNCCSVGAGTRLPVAIWVTFLVE